jgi:acetate kinase
MSDSILALNCGSSSLRFALLERQPDGSFLRREHGHYAGMGHEASLDALLDWLGKLTQPPDLAAVGHRIVHGATRHAPAVLDTRLLGELEALVPLAPLHQPQALAVARRLAARYPRLLQVACFDTAFHRTMPWQEQRLALPDRCHAEGVQRYGFHGLSYEFIAGELARLWGERAQGRIVVAHLGQGSSLCALHALQSRATSMGFTPLEGVPMGTRSGSIDAAVPLYLLERGMDVAQIRALLHEQSGLLALSGSSGDLRTLLASDREAARRAVGFYCHHVAREFASLAAAIGGLDAIVFTGGIGQNAPVVRALIVEQLAWLGTRLDRRANESAAPDLRAACITRPDSAVQAWVMATDEESVIARHAWQVLEERAQ